MAAYYELIERFKEAQAFRKVADRFDMSESVARPQPRFQAISDRLVNVPGFCKMRREQFRLRLHQMRKLRFQDLSDPLMKSPALRRIWWWPTSARKRSCTWRPKCFACCAAPAA